jgi:hypothetical protein
MDEEELVKRFILNNADDEKKVRFLVWGPHMPAAEMKGLLEEAGITELAELVPPEKRQQLKELEAVRGIYRVRYEGPRFIGQFGMIHDTSIDTHDTLFLVVGKIVIPISEEASDDWKQKVRKELSKFFPGINR